MKSVRLVLLLCCLFAPVTGFAEQPRQGGKGDPMKEAAEAFLEGGFSLCQTFTQPGNCVSFNDSGPWACVLADSQNPPWKVCDAAGLQINGTDGSDCTSGGVGTCIITIFCCTASDLLPLK
jgi:hypothetical protein